MLETIIHILWYVVIALGIFGMGVLVWAYSILKPTDNLNRIRNMLNRIRNMGRR